MIESKEPIKCVIYTRVSPTKHVKTLEDIHQSIQESLNMCMNALKQEGNIFVREYRDEYISGKSSKFMPQFQQMMKDARNGLFRRIYARRVNRFGRNRKDMITAELELSEIGITIKFVESGIDTGQPMGKSMMAFLSEIAEMDRNEIIENTKRGRNLAKLEGTRTGKPFGHPKKIIKPETIEMIRRERKVLPVKNRQSWVKLSELTKISVPLMIKKLKEVGYWDEEKRCVK